MNEFQIMAAKVGLKDLFDKRYFDICQFDKLCKLAGCTMPAADYKALRVLHCVDWAEMNPDLRAMVQLKVLQTFEHPTFNQEALEHVFSNPQPLLLQGS